MPAGVYEPGFHQGSAGAKKAANAGHVYITDRGEPSHVMLSYDEHQRLTADRPSVVKLLGQPSGIEGVKFTVPISIDAATPAEFD